MCRLAGVLTWYLSLGQVLWVPLLASGHRPGIYISIARRAALKGLDLLLLLLYTDWTPNQTLVDLPKLSALHRCG